MFEPRPSTERQAIRRALGDAATIVSSNGPFEATLRALLGRLVRAVRATEVVLAIGEPGTWRVRWKCTRHGLLVCDEPVGDANAIGVLSDGVSRLAGTCAYAAVRDDGPIVGALWVTARADAFDDDLAPLCDAFAGYVSFGLQKAALQDRARYLERLIVVDALTGIPNRRAFDSALEREWTRARRSKRPIAVALLDIDHFKLYNDAYGHPRGDACLQEIARACEASVVRATDCFARYGGEEFGLVIPDAELRVAAAIAERLRAAVETLAIPHPDNPRKIVTASVGVASIVPKAGMSGYELVERADRALYRAKGTGRDRVVVLDPAGSEPVEVTPANVTGATNLPAPASPLIGRDTDVARIEDLLAAHRVVTLVGAGGVGKTRLAFDIARRRLGRHRDGVWLIELAALDDAANVPPAFAAPFDVRDQAGRSVTASLVALLRERRVLLVVDNCEHLVASAAAMVAAIVRDAPNAAVLATSREPLGVAGEATYRVPPHEVPLPGTRPDAAEAAEFSAVRLFVERAQAADAGFVLDDVNAGPIAEICRRLDGIALAVELAAARVRVIGVEQIADLLDTRFRVLGEGLRTALPHQKTLRATIEWSYDLLSDVERRLFVRLAIFAGGFTLDAIRSVCADDELQSGIILGALSALVDKSLVTYEAPRYRLLESTREYARERLDGSRERDTVAARHATYFCRLVERMSLNEGNGPYRAWIAPLVDELDNVRAALQWTLGEARDAATGGAIVAGLVETSSLGRLSEWVRWNTRALEAQPADAVTPLRGRLLTRRAELALRYGAFGGTSAAVESAREAGTFLKDAAEPKWRLEQLNAYAAACARAGQAEAAGVAASAGLALARDTSDVVYQASFLRHLARSPASPDPAESIAMYEESIALCRRLGNDFGLALSQHGMSQLFYGLGRFDEAIHAARIASDVRREMGDRRGLAYALADVAQFSISYRRTDGVDAVLREALEVVRTTENDLGMALVIQAAAAYAVVAGEPETAAQLAGYADGAFDSLGTEREPVVAQLRAQLAADLGAALEPERSAALLSAGSALDARTVHAIAARIAAGRTP